MIIKKKTKTKGIEKHHLIIITEKTTKKDQSIEKKKKKVTENVMLPLVVIETRKDRIVHDLDQWIGNKSIKKLQSTAIAKSIEDD